MLVEQVGQRFQDFCVRLVYFLSKIRIFRIQLWHFDGFPDHRNQRNSMRNWRTPTSKCEWQSDFEGTADPHAKAQHEGRGVVAVGLAEHIRRDDRNPKLDRKLYETFASAPVRAVAALPGPHLFGLSTRIDEDA